MEVVFYSKNVQASLFLKKNIKKLGYGCSCAYSLAEMIRLIREKTPKFVFVDSRQINLFGFDVRKHLIEMKATFDYYDLNLDFAENREIPYKVFRSLIENYVLYVEIQNYKSKEKVTKSLVLRKKKLQHHHIILLQQFFQRPNEDISSKTLLNLFWKNTNSNSDFSSSEDHISTLYSYISQVKRFIKTIKMESDILRSGKGMYRLMF
jgi:DNA-binding response OmpR family regulator